MYIYIYIIYAGLRRAPGRAQLDLEVLGQGAASIKKTHLCCCFFDSASLALAISFIGSG